MVRKIIHVDMDAFYASIEQRDTPQYRGKPLAVGYAEKRGVVAAASYEARRYGVRSAMPSVVAKRKCPPLIFTPPRFEVYKDVSKQINALFHEYTDLVEPLSLDEAFLDVTQNHKNLSSATLIAREIKRRIKEETGLTASAGVSFNKFLAKIASDYDKPDGLYVIEPKNAEAFVEKLEIERFFGIGKVTAEKMHQLGIYTGLDLKAWSEGALVNMFGKAGFAYYKNSRAIDERAVQPNRIRKSIGAENTFEFDVEKSERLQDELYPIAQRAWKRIDEKKFLGRTLTLKIKYDDFETITRSRTLFHSVDSFSLFWDTAVDILRQIDTSHKKIRLMGLYLSNTGTPSDDLPIQLELPFKD